MPLFEMKPGALVVVPSSTFANEKILERADLQRLLRDRIDAIADDVLIVAEEFGAFADAKRRIDLLGVDRQGRLVVFELKRTLTGGHLDLQALRYAAMISTMTFDDLVGHYESYLATGEPEAVDEAQARIANWFDDGEDTVISRHVRIVLVSAGFDREITTTVLWLADLYGLDIRCVRLTPYRVGDRLLLDVQQVIPLPEASKLTIQLQRKATQERAIRGADGRDWTQYVITRPGGETEPLRKRQAVLTMITTLRTAGVPAREIARIIPSSRFLSVDGTFNGADLRAAFVDSYPNGDPGRWFMETPIHDEGRTWIVTKMWGRNTESFLEQLTKLAPEQSDIGFEAVSS